MRVGAATAVLGFALAALLTACGGGSGSSAPTAAQGTSSPAATTAPTTTATTPEPAARANHAPRSSSASTHAGSAPFRVKVGDNSIPDYGTEATASDRARAATALGAYLLARARGQWSTACAYLTSETRTKLEAFAGSSNGKPGGCGPAYRALTGPTPAAARADVLSGGLAALRIKGEKAFALFYGPHAQKYMMPMASEGGAWKVTQIAPLPYPLGRPVGPGGG